MKMQRTSRALFLLALVASIEFHVYAHRAIEEKCDENKLEPENDGPGKLIRVQGFRFSPNGQDVEDICKEIWQTEDEPDAPSPQDEQACTTGPEDCNCPADIKDLPEPDKRNVVCKGAAKFVNWMDGNGGIKTAYFDSTQGTGLAKASVTEHVGKEAMSAASSGLDFSDVAQVAGPLALAGAAGGIVVNSVGLLHSVCKDGLYNGTVGSCGGRTKIFAIGVAVTAIVLALTAFAGPGVAVLLGVMSILARRVGPKICKDGIWATIKSFGTWVMDFLEEAERYINEKWQQAKAVNWIKLVKENFQRLPEIVMTMFKRFLKAAKNAIVSAGRALKPNVSKWMEARHFQNKDELQTALTADALNAKRANKEENSKHAFCSLKRVQIYGSDLDSVYAEIPDGELEGYDAGAVIQDLQEDRPAIHGLQA